MLQRLRCWFRGRKTIYCARLYTICGMLVAIQPHIDGNLPSVQALFPSRYWPLAMIGTGILFEVLRWISDGPPRPYRQQDE